MTPTMRVVIGLGWSLAMNALLLQAILIIDTVLVTPLSESSLAVMGLPEELVKAIPFHRRVRGGRWKRQLV